MPNVISADGTKIAYEREGTGPLLIMVDGALCSRSMGPMKSIAKLLSSNFSVVRYDRRGRNDSGDTIPYSIDREVEDLASLIKHLNEAPFIFGISSGAVLILHAAIHGLQFRKIALFEPPATPVSASATQFQDHTSQLRAFVDSDRADLAVKYFLSKMVGVPKFVISVMQILPMWTKLKKLGKTLPYDAIITRPGVLTSLKLKSILTPTLVLWGQKSPPFMKEAASQIAENLPQAKTQELPKQNHNASAKSLAPALINFFT